MKLINIAGKSQPDPYIIKNGDTFYIYCTGVEGVHCYKSKTLFTNWQYCGIVLSVEGEKEYWAPSVIERNGKFYMYYSSMPIDEEDVHTEAIKVAVANTPDGKFNFVKNLLPPFSIDAHVVENQSGLYIFYSVNDYDSEKAGTYIVVDKMLDEFTVAGEPHDVVRPTIDEEIFENDRFKQGQNWYTLEGAYYFRYAGIHYCIYSANSYLKSTYHLGYSYCADNSDKLNQIDFVKAHPDEYRPLLCGDSTEISTGHNSMIEVDGELYIVYHGRDFESNLSCDDRTARICKLVVNDGKLSIMRM